MAASGRASISRKSRVERARSLLRPATAHACLDESTPRQHPGSLHPPPAWPSPVRSPSLWSASSPSPENESGVIFSTPITRVRSPSARLRLRSCHQLGLRRVKLMGWTPPQTECSIPAQYPCATRGTGRGCFGPSPTMLNSGNDEALCASSHGCIVLDCAERSFRSACATASSEASGQKRSPERGNRRHPGRARALSCALGDFGRRSRRTANLYA